MALRLLEVAPSVKSNATQPQEFEYLDGICGRRYATSVDGHKVDPVVIRTGHPVTDLLASGPSATYILKLLYST